MFFPRPGSVRRCWRHQYAPALRAGSYGYGCYRIQRHSAPHWSRDYPLRLSIAQALPRQRRACSVSSVCISLARAGRLCAATTFSTSPPVHRFASHRAVGLFSVIVQQLFNQLLQVTATAVEDLDDLLLLRGQGPATRSANSSVPSRILANGVFSSCDRWRRN